MIRFMFTKFRNGNIKIFAENGKTRQYATHIGGGEHLPNFDDTTVAMRAKSTRDLVTSLVILKACQYGLLVDNAEKLLNLVKKIFGNGVYTKLVKATLYRQFVSGEHQKDIDMVSRQLKDYNISCMYYIPNEEISENVIMADKSIREEEYNQNSKLLLQSVDVTSLNGSFTQTKLTPLINVDILEKLSARMQQYLLDHESRPQSLKVQTWSKALGKTNDSLVAELSQTDNKHITNALRRFDRLAQAAQEKGVKLMLDAEYYHLQPCMDTIILALQQKYNQGDVLVYNTYQCYRKDTLARIQNDIALAKKHNFKLACKLVRGAYMDFERQRAQELAYDSPICDTYEDTGKNYKKATELMLSLVSEGKGEVMLATHNEECILYGLNKMKELGVASNSAASFGQIYGMADYISYGLGNAGYQVHKSVPYGSVEQSVLYLLRRAQENRTMVMRNAKERRLLRQEIARRINQKPRN